jgi:polyisoprenoid-binding protein YceI
MSPSRSLLALSLVTASAAFAAWTQEGAGTVTFDAKGPAGFKIHGASDKAAVADDGKNLKVSVKLEDIDTDNGLRNKHMLEDTHAKEFPVVTLTVPTASLKESGAQETTGTFELNGQKKDVKFTYTPKCAGSVCEIEASAPLNLGDFGIKIRSYLGVTVKPDITVGAKFKVKK